VAKVELGTFGAILKFALDTEGEVGLFYKSASGSLIDQNLVAMFHELASRGEKRIKTLERVRRENITEMILEPILGFDSDAFSVSTRIPASASDAALKQMAVDIESKLQKLYKTAAIKIDFLSEAAYVFELLSEKNEEAKNRLESS
jgi:hypothetical protein